MKGHLGLCKSYFFMLYQSGLKFLLHLFILYEYMYLVTLWGCVVKCAMAPLEMPGDNLEELVLSSYCWVTEMVE